VRRRKERRERGKEKGRKRRKRKGKEGALTSKNFRGDSQLDAVGGPETFPAIVPPAPGL
jgi:hypothetical protein